MLYRIYTANENEVELENLVKKYSNSFTRYNTTGFWKRKKENSVVFEFLIGNNNFGNRMMLQLGQEIKKLNGQDSILVVKIHTEHEFV